MAESQIELNDLIDWIMSPYNMIDSLSNVPQVFYKCVFRTIWS